MVIFGLLYHVQPVLSEPSFLNTTKSGSSEVEKTETIELPCEVNEYPDEIEITWKKMSYDLIENDNEIILAVGDKVQLEDDNRFSVDHSREGNEIECIKTASVLKLALSPSPRTPSISGLKSQILKPTFLS